MRVVYILRIVQTSREHQASDLAGVHQLLERHVTNETWQLLRRVGTGDAHLVATGVGQHAA